jgi:hypothetical protein
MTPSATIASESPAARGGAPAGGSPRAPEAAGESALPDVQVVRRRLAGWWDVVWLAALVLVGWMMVDHLTGHIGREVETLKLGHRLVQLDQERLRLHEEQNRLRSELDYRRNRLDPARYALDVLGMQPVQAVQIVEAGP